MTVHRCRLPIVALLALAFVVFGGTAFAAVPGPQRMLFPTLFGFHAVADGIYAPADMNPSRAAAVVSMIGMAETRVDAFYDETISRPRVVLCPRSSCDGVFGRTGAAGLAYGWLLIRLNDKGMNPVIVTHEFSHAAVKAKVGALREIEGRVPAWFDEGLASYVSGDARLEGAYSTATLDRVRASGPWWRWQRTVRAVGWHDAYGGALHLIRDLKGKIGDNGLVAIVTRVGNGESFDAAVAAEETRAAHTS